MWKGLGRYKLHVFPSYIATLASVFLTCLLFLYSVPGRHDERKERLIFLGVWAPALSALWWVEVGW